MKAEEIRKTFNDRLVAEDDAEAALRVEEVALQAKHNELLREQIDMQRAMFDWQTDPEKAGKLAFETQLGLQKALSDYNIAHPLAQLGVAMPGRRRG